MRAILDGQGLTRNLSTLKNLIAYSADWSDWMGFQHPGENGQWPHLDALFADANIDLVGFDNYLPLSDWTTASGGLDVANWNAPAPSIVGPAFDMGSAAVAAGSTSIDCGLIAASPAALVDCGTVTATAWPPASPAFNGLGLTGAPTILSKPYLKANIEGGQYFNWFYDNSNNDGRGATQWIEPTNLAAGRRPAGSGAQSLFSEPADPRQQAAPLVVEQSAFRPL